MKPYFGLSQNCHRIPIVVGNSVKTSSFIDLSKALFPGEDGEREEIAEEAQRAHNQQEDALDPKLDLEKERRIREDRWRYAQYSLQGTHGGFFDVNV